MNESVRMGDGNSNPVQNPTDTVKRTVRGTAGCVWISWVQ
jgi:hypothetical protein